MVARSVLDLEGTVHLLEHEDPGEVVREGHTGDGQAQGGARLDGRVQPAGPAEDEGDDE